MHLGGLDDVMEDCDDEAEVNMATVIETVSGSSTIRCCYCSARSNCPSR